MPQEYKFRAETVADADKWIIALHVSGAGVESIHVRLVDELTPDVVVTFYSNDTLDEIRDVMRHVVDGHVMWQTVQPVAEYTGERDYEL